MVNYSIPKSQDWEAYIKEVRKRFDKEYRNDTFDLPAEVESMPLFREWIGKTLTPKIASPFWKLAQFKKNQRCLDIGCGVSFLVYPWVDWNVFFYGQEISSVACDALNSRGSQLNSKLFKGVKRGAAHQLEYENDIFDRAIATGFSCYYPSDYWRLVLQEVKRVLKPDGLFIFDAVNPESEMAENWAILETYLGAEVFLSPLSDFKDLVAAERGKIVAKQEGELHQMYRVSFSL